jgi:type IV pilus assembly protein PilB
MVKFNEEKQEEKIKDLREKEAEDLAKLLAGKYGLPYLNLSMVSIGIDALKVIPEAEAKEANMVAFQGVGKKLQIGVLSPNPDPVKKIIARLEDGGYKLTIFMVSEVSLKKAFARYADVAQYTATEGGMIDVSPERLEKFMEETKTIEQIKDAFNERLQPKNRQKTSEILEIILAGSVASNASDIHIEPQEKDVRLRLRLDGALHDVLDFRANAYALFLSRIKLIAGLKLNIRNQAQDGRFSINIKDTDIEVRVSVIPSSYGESIVMRILNPKSISVPLEELGIDERLYNILIKEIRKPNGMLLTTGPTGSGKTTALYAFLKKIYSPENKIITLENPIEYHLKGIVQTQVEEDKGYTFAGGLRSVLRQDPDVIMVGEIRDNDTASIAVNAALTGHLVFSTLHTNNAAGAIPRLVDLGVNPNVIGAALNVVMAQRLVRKLCNSCKEKAAPTAEELKILTRTIESMPEDIEKPKTNDIALWKPKGCDACGGIGYKGRIGIFEAILVDENIEPLIAKKAGETEIMQAAKKQGILTMQEDGILKVLKGIISLEELSERVEL